MSSITCIIITMPGRHSTLAAICYSRTLSRTPTKLVTWCSPHHAWWRGNFYLYIIRCAKEAQSVSSNHSRWQLTVNRKQPAHSHPCHIDHFCKPINGTLGEHEHAARHFMPSAVLAHQSRCSPPLGWRFLSHHYQCLPSSGWRYFSHTHSRCPSGLHVSSLSAP